jgi:hypothetical protein
MIQERCPLATIEELEALQKGIASRVKKVKFKDQEIEYHSIDEMVKRINIIKKELGYVKKKNRKVIIPVKGL